MKFYGWKIVGALFVILIFSSGLGFYNHSIIVQALAADAKFSIEVASLAVSVFFIASGVAGLVMAPLMEKYDMRWFISAGAILSAVSLYALGYVDSRFELFVIYTAFGVGYAATSLLPSTTLIARWFETGRARALSIASTGLSVGGALLTPFSAALVERLGLTTATSWLGLIYLVGVVPIALIYIRSSPGHLGLQPDGGLTRSNLASEGVSFSEGIRHHFFWGLSFLYVLIMLAQVGGIAHQFGILSERLTTAQASIGIAILPIFSVIGRLVGGLVLGSIPTLGFTLVMIIVQGAALLLIGSAESPFLMYLGFAAFGSSVGNLLMLHPLIIAEVYGLRHYSRFYSWTNMIMLCGVSSGPALMGWLYGYTGQYASAYWLAGGLCLLAGAGFVLIRPPLRR